LSEITTLVVAISTGVLSSVAASIVWLWGLRRMRPRIEISPVMTEEPSSRSPHNVSYSIKLINRSRRAAVDLEFELTIIRPQRTRGGAVNTRRDVAVSGSAPMLLPPATRGDLEAHNAYRLRTNFPIRWALETYPDSHVRLRVLAKDEVSGTGRVFEAKYHEPSTDMKVGKFARGETFDVVPGAEPPAVSARRAVDTDETGYGHG
jgi:hypothetical protein